MTNTVALVTNSAGAALGSRQELAGQQRRLRVLTLPCGIGVAIGAALLLTSDESVFTAVVFWLVALGTALLLLRDQIRQWCQGRRSAPLRGEKRRLYSWRVHLVTCCLS